MSNFNIYKENKPLRETPPMQTKPGLKYFQEFGHLDRKKVADEREKLLERAAEISDSNLKQTVIEAITSVYRGCRDFETVLVDVNGRAVTLYGRLDTAGNFEGSHPKDMIKLPADFSVGEILKYLDPWLEK